MATSTAKMTLNLPTFNYFDVHSSPMSLGPKWKLWLGEFQNLMIALNVEDKIRQKALLLFYAGHDVHEIYKTLEPAADEDCDSAVTRLINYFAPKIYHFRKMHQNEPSVTKRGEVETIDEYVTRLKKASTRCEFTDKNLEIKLQIVFGCISKRVRRKALSEDISLDDLVKFSRAVELSSVQAEVIEDDKSEGLVNYIAREYIVNFVTQTRTWNKIIPGRKNVLAAEVNYLTTGDERIALRTEKLVIDVIN